MASPNTRATPLKEACLLFPSDLMNPKACEPHFLPERRAAMELGLKTMIVDDQKLHSSAALSLDADSVLLYRGWMLSAEEYTALEEAAESTSLVTDTASYLQAHYLPNWYPAFEAHTPRSVYGPADSGEKLLRQLGSGPAIVKDYVKSLKHLWDSACFIPDVAETDQALSVINEFIKQRGEIQGGLILREYEQLQSEEYRSWWVDGRCRLLTAHPDTPGVLPPEIDTSFLNDSVNQLDARIISVDLVLNNNDEWRVIEVGDGAVSDRPESCDPHEFLQQLIVNS